jgi:hypothetical protein
MLNKKIIRKQLQEIWFDNITKHEKKVEIFHLGCLETIIDDTN